MRVIKQQHKRQVENETPIAFLATLSVHAHHLGANQNIAFDQVITNLGDAYNPHVGGFIAPVSGVYVFSTTLFSYPATDAHFGVLHNWHLVITLYQETSIGSKYDTSSTTVVLQLSNGDVVSIANRDADKSLHGYGHTSFTGFLLKELYDDNVVSGD